jgi:hypothetical protein
MILSGTLKMEAAGFCEGDLAQCVRMEFGVQNITGNYMDYFLNRILLKQ